MASELDTKSLEQAFESRPDIRGAIQAAAVTPAYIELFNQISLHICSLSPETSSSSSEPASKKRRLHEEAIPNRGAGAANGHSASKPTTSSSTSKSAAPAFSTSTPVLLEIKDISVVVPQRKKYTLCFTSTHLYARLPDSPDPAHGIIYSWRDLDRIFYLPVPEKAQVQHNYVLFPRGSLIPASKPSPDAPAAPEPLVFTIPATAPKPGTISGADAGAAASVADDYRALVDWALTRALKDVRRNNDVPIVRADPKLFHSALRQSHRPDEKAVHVRAFRGSKDGYLFFLPSGILWAFKKPLIFIPHERVVAVSYTSVLQRTFDLCVEIAGDEDEDGGRVKREDGDEEQVPGQEIEFSMLDQEDFAGIDAYVKRHGLLDRSMAEQRKAKRANVNVVRDEDGNVVGNVEAGELARAGLTGDGGAGEDLDEEDEEEEDYDPGSEGESEGSGTSSSEEDDDEDGEGGGDDDDEDDEEEEEGEDEL